MKHAIHSPKTVWSKNALPLVPPRYRSIYTVLLPTIYVGLILFGIQSFFVGSKIVTEFTVPWFSPAWAVTTFLGAAVGLFALATQHDRVELVGQFMVGIGLLIYISSTVLFIFGGSPTSALTLILTLLRVASTVWRIQDLAGEIARKEAARAR